MPERPFVLVGQQYLADPARSVGDVHPLYSYAHVPRGYDGDATEAIIGQIERFARGFRERIIGLEVRSTAGFASYNANFVGGDILTGAKTIRQLACGPRTTTRPYDVGVPGHFICSAATPQAQARTVCAAPTPSSVRSATWKGRADLAVTKRLSVLDSTFLSIETTDTRTQVASLMEFAIPAGAPADFVADLVVRLREPHPLRRPFNQLLTHGPTSALAKAAAWPDPADVDLPRDRRARMQPVRRVHRDAPFAERRR